MSGHIRGKVELVAVETFPVTSLMRTFRLEKIRFHAKYVYNNLSSLTSFNIYSFDYNFIKQVVSFQPFKFRESSCVPFFCNQYFFFVHSIKLLIIKQEMILLY